MGTYQPKISETTPTQKPLSTRLFHVIKEGRNWCEVIKCRPHRKVGCTTNVISWLIKFISYLISHCNDLQVPFFALQMSVADIRNMFQKNTFRFEWEGAWLLTLVRVKGWYYYFFESGWICLKMVSRQTNLHGYGYILFVRLFAIYLKLTVPN